MKNKVQEVEGSGIIDEVLSNAKPENTIFVSRSLEIAHQIIVILEKKGLLQKDLANKMGKSEAEVSKWLSGFHNFTIKTISNIEAVLGERIITTPKQTEEINFAWLNMTWPIQGFDITFTPLKFVAENDKDPIDGQKPGNIRKMA